MLRYHQRTADLLSQSLDSSPRATKELELREHVLGIQFPASIREWYTTDNGVQVLKTCGNDDPVHSVQDLGRSEGGYGFSPPDDPLSQGYLVIMYENQAVVRWAIHLNGTDDPPVVVQRQLPDNEWHAYADKFSTFVYSRVWDWQVTLAKMGCRFLAFPQALTRDTLAFLQTRFEEEAQSWTWPTPAIYRFTSPDHVERILIWDDEEDANWWVWGASQAALAELGSHIWSVLSVAPGIDPLDEEAAVVLNSLSHSQ